MSETEQQLIDVEKIVADKAGKYSSYIPSFVTAWLKHILHQDELNLFIWESRNIVGVDWLEECVRYLDMKLTIVGKENLPCADDGKLYTFVSNHPLGGEDGVALGAILGRHYNGNIKYLVNNILMNLPGLAPLCIPINKIGSQGREFPKLIEAVFASNHNVIMFPAGLCSRRFGKVIHDLPWSKTFIRKSVETKRDIVPIHFGGHNSSRFYIIANICKTLGIKVNLAMLFLVDEMYKNRHKEFEVKIGAPIPWETFDHSKKAQEWASDVQNIVYKL